MNVMLYVEFDENYLELLVIWLCLVLI